MVMPKYNDDPDEYYYQPIGLLYVSSYLKEKGFDVHCVNMNHYGPQKLTEVLSSDNFDVVCTGGMHVHFYQIKAIIKEVKTFNPKILTIIGGGLVTADPQFALQHLGANYLVLSEGEESCANLLTALQENKNPENVLGIVYYKDGAYFETPEAPLIEDLDSLPYPDYDSFEFEHYLDKYQFFQQNEYTVESPRLTYVAGSRDCPLKCTFCFRTMGGDYRERSVDDLITEMKYMVDRYGINQIILSDEIFALNKKRAFEFCEKVKPLNIPWTGQMRVNMAEEDILQKMKESGCVTISYGFESASKEVLKSMKKGIKVEQLEKAMKLTRENQMTLQANYIFGDPAETVETVVETLAFNRAYKQYAINLGMLAAYPGTPMYFDVLKKGLINDATNFFVNSQDEYGGAVNLTNMSDDDFSTLRLKLDLEREQLRVFGKLMEFRGDGQHYFFSTACPHCDEINENRASKIKRAKNQLNYPLSCNHCFQRYFVNPLELPEYRNPIKRFARKWVAKLRNFTIFLLTLKFEPAFYYNKKKFFAFSPVYYAVQYLKINSALRRLLLFYRKIMRIRVRENVGEM